MSTSVIPKTAQSITTLLQKAKTQIDAVDARVLLQHILKTDRACLATHGDQMIDAEHAKRYQELVARRAVGEPVAYLTGTREFYGLNFYVTPAVLIPRPETELLVDLTLARIAPHAPMRVLDLGTGSGVIAISIAYHRPSAQAIAVDQSKEALAIASKNATQLLANRANAIRFLQSDWFEALAGERFHVIVSNPPYVASGDSHLSQGDLRFEPSTALVAGTDGMNCLRHIIHGAKEFLAPGGHLLLEHGHDQKLAVQDLMRGAGYVEIGGEEDLAGLPRVSFGSV